jgi:hypothetical protein
MSSRSTPARPAWHRMDGAILPVIPNHPTHRPDRFPEHLTLSDERRADRVRLEAFLPVTGELVQPLGGRAEPGEYHHLPPGSLRYNLDQIL